MENTATATVTSVPVEALLTVEDLAEMLRLPKRTLYSWRLNGEGPASIPMGRTLRYRLSVVNEWLDSLQSADDSAA